MDLQLPEGHGLNANHRPVGSQWDPVFDKGFPLSLVSGFSDVEYVYPFYYGLSGENVFIMMFDNEGNDGEIRFAQTPDGAGQEIQHGILFISGKITKSVKNSTFGHGQYIKNLKVKRMLLKSTNHGHAKSNYNLLRLVTILRS